PSARRISAISVRACGLSSMIRTLSGSRFTRAVFPDCAGWFRRVLVTDWLEVPLGSFAVDRETNSGRGCQAAAAILTIAEGGSTPGGGGTGGKCATAGLTAVAQEGVGEHQRQHRFHHRSAADADAGVVTSGGADVDLGAGLIERAARGQDRRGGLEGDP